ncbi:unnamed protein product, partial [marine sediment metagenome]
MADKFTDYTGFLVSSFDWFDTSTKLSAGKLTTGKLRTRTFENIQKYSKIFENVQKYSKTFKNIRKMNG